MNVTEFYDASNHFLRDALGYWLPGVYFTFSLFFRFSQIDMLTFPLFVTLTKDLNLFNFMLLVFFAMLSGYLSGFLSSGIFSSAIDTFLERNKLIKHHAALQSEVFAHHLSVRTGESSYDFIKGKPHLARMLRTVMAEESAWLNPHSRSRLERLNSFRLLSQNMCLQFVISALIFSSWGNEWTIAFALLAVFAMLFAYKYRKGFLTRKRAFAITNSLLRSKEADPSNQ